MKTYDLLKQIIADIANIDPAIIHEESSLKKDLGLTSIQIIRLIYEVQSNFDFTFDIKDYNDENFDAIGPLLRLLEKKQLDLLQKEV